MPGLVENEDSILAIDPGDPFGWAYFERGSMKIRRAGVVGSAKLVDKKATWNDRADQIGAAIDRLVDALEPDVVACEWPAFFASAGGQATAKTGSLVKLAVHVGIVQRIAFAEACTFIPVEVNMWKGQLSKEVVVERIKRFYSGLLGSHQAFDMLDGVETHAWDAVGIGLFCRRGGLC